MKKDSSNPKRTLAKAISWESISTVVTMAIAYLFIGNLECSVALALTCLVAKVILFYYHDRLWHSVSWGKDGNNNS
jgi:uncharacterized membrane protein